MRFGNRNGSTNTSYYQGAHADTQNTSQPIWATFMNSVLSGKSRQEFPESDHKAEYKSNSSWTFSKTEAYANNGYYSIYGNSYSSDGDGYDSDGGYSGNGYSSYGGSDYSGNSYSQQYSGGNDSYTGGSGTTYTDTTGGGNSTSGSTSGSTSTDGGSGTGTETGGTTGGDGGGTQ